jgi:tetratricopeptide (TPR) repeat protein
MGDLLSSKMDDMDQARFAYVQALCEEPKEADYADMIVRLTGSDRAAWGEVLETCSQAATDMPAGDRKNALLAVMGDWYEQRFGRPDLALQCHQAILMSAPADDAALAAMAEIFRQAQQWRELAETLELRADAAVAPATGRNLKVEAAKLRLEHLSDRDHASRLLEQVLRDDPAHAAAARALAALYLDAGDLSQYVRVMQQRASATSGEHRLEVLSDLAKIQGERLGNVAEAVTLYEQILSQSPSDLVALKQLEAAYSATGKPDQLLRVLDRQLELAVTPRQKVSLLERIAALHADEFFDLDAATVAWERIVELEPTHADALERLTQAYRRLERWGTLAWTLERRAEAATDDATRARTLLELGAIVTKQLGEPDRAVDVYERVVAMDPTEATALDALASLRSQLGDEARAAAALDSLAERESDPARRADHLVRAGAIVERRGDVGGAITRYRKALDLAPGHRDAALHLAGAYEGRADVAKAVDVLTQTRKLVEDALDKAALDVELAGLLLRTGERGRAEPHLRSALEHQPTNAHASLLLADLEFERGAYAEAVRGYDVALDALSEVTDDADRRGEVLFRYAVALDRVGEGERARSVLRQLEAGSDELPATLRVAELAFSVCEPEDALERVQRLLDRHGPQLSAAELSRALYWEGETLRRIGRPRQARASLDRASQVDRTAAEPLRSLAELLRELGDYQELDATLAKLASRLEGDAHADVLVERGDLAAKELGAPQTAAKRYLAALSVRPKDRRVLLKIMDLHSRGGDWTQLVGDILQLVELTDDPAQKAKYLQTAARVTAIELGDTERTLELLDRALALDPDSDDLVKQAIELKGKLGDTDGVRELLEGQIRRAAARSDREQALRLATELADLHLAELHVDDAIAVNEMALKIAGHDPSRESVLVELYATDPVRYLDRAVALERAAIKRDPFQPEPYRMLRKLYADAKRRDATWVCCQALSILGSTTPDEALFFKRHRRKAPVPPGTRITEDDWADLVVHPDADPILTRIYAEIQPVIAADRGRTFEALGFKEADALDPATCPGTLIRSLELASYALRIRMPLLFLDHKAKAPITMSRGARRSLLLSEDGVRSELPAVRATFVAATHLAYLRAGFYVRMLVPSLQGLKSWMLAAIKLLAPKLPVASELEGSVDRCRTLLDEALTGPMRDKLAEPVDDLLRRGGKADVARWTAGVDLTTDRVGLVLCDDLSTVLKTVTATGDAAAAVTATGRTRALVEYSVGREYLTLRDRLRLSLDWREVEELDLDKDVVEFG